MVDVMFLLIINILCGISLALVGSLSFWKIKDWTGFYIPIVLFICGLIIGFLLMFAFYRLVTWMISYNKQYKRTSKFYGFITKIAADFILLIMNAKTTIVNKRKMPRSGRYLVVCNHLSSFDPIVIYKYFANKEIGIITKEENFKIPMVNRLMYRLFCLPIKKGDYLQSLDSMKKSALYIQNNVTSIGVFPEGKRSPDGTLQPFHEGVFNIAIKSQVPLVVMSLTNTNLIKHNSPWKKTHVRLKILNVMPFEEFQDWPAKKLSNHVFDMIQNDLKQ